MAAVKAEEILYRIVDRRRRRCHHREQEKVWL